MRIETDEQLPLSCPICGEDYLHHETVEVFDRKEDAEQGLHVTVSRPTFNEESQDTGMSIDTNQAANPSSRRHGLAVHFFCECCHGRSVLTLAQHRGQTLVAVAPMGSGMAIGYAQGWKA